MKKPKIIITFTLIIIIISLFLSGCGIFTNSKSNGLIFRDIDSNTCEVIGYKEPISKKISEFITRFFIKEKDNDIVIPSEYKGKKVVSIGSSAFYECYGLESIVIPDSVTSIGSSAFYHCSSLEKVYYNGTLEDWCNIEFSNVYSNPMSHAEHFYMKDSNNEYYEITSMTELEIPNTVTSIGSYQFYSFDNITSVVISNSVTSIGYGAFYECSSLESIILPFIGNTLNGTTNTHFGYIFGASSYFDNINYVPTSLKEVIITGGSSIGKDAFYECSSLEKVIIEDRVTSIEYASFSGCSSLESIVIPESVANIDILCFSSNLKSVYYCGTINDWCNIRFNGLGSNLMNSAEHFYMKDSNNEYYEVTEIEIPNTVTSIGYEQFSGFDNITTIVIPSSVTSIGTSAFSGCSSLESVYYNGTLEDWCNIEFSSSSSNPMYYAEHFYMKDSNNEYYEVTEIEIPNTVTNIGSYQFCGFDNITSVVIPSSVTSIGQYAFCYCSSLESIVIPDSVTSIGSSVFSGCDRLIIYCETESQPSGWNSIWNSGARPVIWGYRN